MTETQISCFLAISNHLNFARASEELNISQPAVTHQIQSLEAELGVKLFKRSTRSVSLTEEGEYFLDDAKSIQQSIFRAKMRFSASTVAEYHTLTVGCSSPAQIKLLSPALIRMRNEYPDFHPIFRHVSPTLIPPKIDDEILDVAFGMRLELTSEKKVIYKELIRTPLCCICPKDHPISSRESVTLDDLDDYKLIVYTPMSAPPDVAIVQKKLLEHKSVVDTYLCEFAEDAIHLVESGYGIAVLPELFIPGWAGVCAVPIENVKKLSFGAYYKAHSANKTLRTFMKMIDFKE